MKQAVFDIVTKKQFNLNLMHTYLNGVECPHTVAALHFTCVNDRLNMQSTNFVVPGIFSNKFVLYLTTCVNFETHQHWNQYVL